ncbi:MAG: ABC transporter ATP-binding protein [Verrucomicrobia bacterium]|nr:ABC transporter ATP-binding protein [Verrucomicrobiota bacterium]
MNEPSTRTGPVIDVVDVKKTYMLGHKAVPVLNGVSLHVNGGERVAIVGRSGAGKSTLLHILGLLDHPDSGSVHLDGENAFSLSKRRRTTLRAHQIGFVFQSYNLMPEMDSVENVLLPAFAVRSPIRNARERAALLLSQVGLGERLHHRPMELSGGEQQRVALARALMNEPRFILADEPTGNLDERTGRQILDHLFTLCEARSHALIIVTHDVRTAQLCDRILHLEGGRIVS